MSFSKINYKDNETIITADNLNDIQDAILEGYQPDGTIEYTAFAESTKLALLNLIYPIGSIYMNVDNISPANQFGGTWEQIKDRFILAAGSSYTAGTTGGAATVTLTANEMPSHNHSSGNYNTSGSLGYQSPTDVGYVAFAMPWTYVSGRTDLNICVATNGGDQPHNNMPPYLVAYMWKRIA